jgi:hypothetical protein
MFDWKLFPHTDFNKVNLDWVIDCLKAMVGGNTNQILSKKSDEDFDFEWIDNTGGSGGTTDYNQLNNKPSINGSTLQGNKTAAQLGLVGAEVGKQLSTNDYTNADKEKLDSIVFVTQSSTFAEVDAAYTAGKKVVFFNSGEMFVVVEKPNNTTYRFVHVNSGGGVRTAVITSGGSWTLATAANPGSYIKYISQTLSDTQKAQARTNIGSVSVSDYNPDDKTEAMTQAVGKDSNGKLWTSPGKGGSSEVLEQIYLGVLSEDGTNKWYVDRDMNGNPFELSKIIVRCKCVAAADNSVEGYGKIFANVPSDHNAAFFSHRLVNVNGFFRRAGQTSTMAYYAELIQGEVLLESLFKGDSAAINSAGEITGYMSKSSEGNMGMMGEYTDSFTSIMVATDAAAKFGAGSVLAIYGVRA